MLLSWLHRWLFDPYLVAIIVYSLLLSPQASLLRRGGHIFLGSLVLPKPVSCPEKGPDHLPPPRPWGETPQVQNEPVMVHGEHQSNTQLVAEWQWQAFGASQSDTSQQIWGRVEWEG